jgi:hypothetical protein
MSCDTMNTGCVFPVFSHNPTKEEVVAKNRFVQQK